MFGFVSVHSDNISKLIDRYQKWSQILLIKFVTLLSTCTIAYKLKIITQRKVVWFLFQISIFYISTVLIQSQKWSQQVLNKFVTNITWQVHHCKLNKQSDDWILFSLYCFHSFHYLYINPQFPEIVPWRPPHTLVTLLSTSHVLVIS